METMLLVAQIPDNGQVMQRYCDYYSNRQRGARRKAEEGALVPGAGAYGSEAVEVKGDGQAAAGGPSQTRVSPSSREARLRWAELLRRIYEVEPLTCPVCGTQMRIIAVIVQPKVIDKILGHLRAKGHDPRAGPWAAALASAPPAA
jgi:hypothetical protein